jgi:mono/diheme cytochrome c family protein
MNHHELNWMPTLRRVVLAALVGVFPWACQQSSEEASSESEAMDDAAEAAEVARVDTPPEVPQGAGTTETAGGSQPDTAISGDAAGAAAAPRDQGRAQDTGAEAGQAAGEAGGGQASGDIVNGWKQYEANCSRCHGQDALGSALAPDLRQSVKGRLGREDFIQVVTNGRSEKGMPGFKAQLDRQKVEDILAYLVARSTGQLGPGRPGA